MWGRKRGGCTSRACSRMQAWISPLGTNSVAIRITCPPTHFLPSEVQPTPARPSRGDLAPLPPRTQPSSVTGTARPGPGRPHPPNAPSPPRVETAIRDPPISPACRCPAAPIGAGTRSLAVVHRCRSPHTASPRAWRLQHAVSSGPGSARGQGAVECAQGGEPCSAARGGGGRCRRRAVPVHGDACAWGHLGPSGGAGSADGPSRAQCGGGDVVHRRDQGERRCARAARRGAQPPLPRPSLTASLATLRGRPARRRPRRRRRRSRRGHSRF